MKLYSPFIYIRLFVSLIVVLTANTSMAFDPASHLDCSYIQSNMQLLIDRDSLPDKLNLGQPLTIHGAIVVTDKLASQLKNFGVIIEMPIINTATANQVASSLVKSPVKKHISLRLNYHFTGTQPGAFVANYLSVNLISLTQSITLSCSLDLARSVLISVEDELGMQMLPVY